MAEQAVHPGSWLGDGVEEFKKASPVAKVLIVVSFVAVAGIGYYEYSKNKAANTSGVAPLGTASPSTDLSGAGANQYPTVPGGNTGQVPVLPGGLQPLFDAAGNLIGFEPIPPASTGTTTGTGTGTGTGSGSGGKSGGGGKKKKPPHKEGSGDGHKTSGGGSQHVTGHSGGHTSTGHTVKQHQQKAQGSKPTVTSHKNQGGTPPKKTVQPHNTGGSHGYVYTTKPGDTITSLQFKFFPTSNGSNKQGNILQYGNNKQILTSQNVNKHGAIKPGTKILA